MNKPPVDFKMITVRSTGSKEKRNRQKKNERAQLNAERADSLIISHLDNYFKIDNSRSSSE